ncbi:MAG: Gfo/Idh/MocA family protein [Thermodesulfobacteriota bacterium]
MNRRLKTALIGYGYMGEIRRRVIERTPRLELSGIFDASHFVREKINGCHVFDSFETLMKEELDIIFVCTPNLYSPQYCMDSLNMGKHVFCEKPPGRSLDDIKNIIRVEKDNPRAKLMFGFNHRFHPGIMRAKVIAESGRLGNILNIRGLYGKSGGVNFRDSWRNNKEIAGGGILLDQGIHMLDLFRYFCGDFEYIKCFLNNRFWRFETEDNAFVILANENGQNAFFHSSATMWKHTFRVDLTLENGYVAVEGLLSKTGSYGREKLIIGKRQFEDEAEAIGNPSEEITYFDRDLSWELEVQEFIRCIDENIPVAKSSSEDALKVMEIIDKAYKDAASESVR